ncbi:hypothetical protein Q8G10_27690, partial [Klebsiella pneumoniae]|nr:hypothetical protein [Klebsiella pneumoniae]
MAAQPAQIAEGIFTARENDQVGVGQRLRIADIAHPDVWLRESGMAHAVEQARQRKVPLLGICGGYQMLGETIIDEVESGLGAQPGLGVLKTVTHFAQHKTTTQVQATLGSALPDWLADAARLRVSGYEIHMGETRREAGCPPLLQLHKA